MPSILVTNFQDNGEDVMVFTEQATAAQLAATLKARNAHFDECYEVPEQERQFYVFDPCWLTPENEARVLAAA
jgi:hypothetical protein